MKEKSDSGSKGVPPTPNGFDEEQKTLWEGWPAWRSTYLNKRSQIRKALLIDSLKVNLPGILIAIAIGILLHLYTPVSITSSSLSRLAIGILSASAAILTIIVAFLTFWFGSANNNMQRTRATIRDELRSLEVIERDINPFTAGPKESIAGELKNKLEELAQRSETFLNALKILGGRFHRAALGTYYDKKDLFKLEMVITDVGGEWFKAHWAVFRQHSERAFSRKTWEDAMGISSRLSQLNDEVSRATNQIMQIIYFMPTLISMLFIFIFSLAVALISTTTFLGNLSPIIYLICGSILVILLATHLVNAVRFLWILVSSRYFSYETSRLLDIQRSDNLEQRYPLDYEAALKRYAETIVKAYAKEDTNSE